MPSPRVRFDIDVGGVARLLSDFADEFDSTMDQAMSLAVDIVADEAKLRAPDKTGEVKNSIGTVVSGTFAAGTLTGIVSAGAPHALPVEDGSVPHVIRPKYRRALRFPLAGGAGGFGFAKRVDHPGTVAKPFLEPALESKGDEVVDVFRDARDLAALRAKKR